MTEWIVINQNYVFSVAVVLGAIINWLIRAFNKEAPWNPLEYWLRNHPKRSTATVLSLLGAIGMAWGTDVVTKIPVDMAFWLGLLGGIALDSGLNKGKRQALKKRLEQ